MNQKRKDQQKKLERELLLGKLNSKEGAHQLVLILDNLKEGFNISKIIRTAEAFSLKEVHIIGTEFFDPYPAKGAIKRVNLKFYTHLHDSIHELTRENYNVYLFDIDADTYIHENKLSKKSAFIFGNEEMGTNIEDVDHKILRKTKIQQFGLTESLNVSIAASIASYEYLRQTAL